MNVCAYDGRPDHTSETCPHLDNGGRVREFPPLTAISCAFCLAIGHWAPACPRERDVTPV